MYEAIAVCLVEFDHFIDATASLTCSGLLKSLQSLASLENLSRLFLMVISFLPSFLSSLAYLIKSGARFRGR